MKLSVIIINYNVKFFLEQCLLSIQKSIGQLKILHPDYDVEIFVVDNNSVDDSVEMIRKKFPGIILIENKENKGFAAANNQAIILSHGEFILMINPDTVVEEYTLQKTLEFMDINSDAGALGVKMIDGKGNFLPESKRSLPTPSIAFFKIFGFSRLFPRSKIFGRYHLGYLDNNQVHEVEVLAGAFMMVRKSVLDITGTFDEAFFMYGEDIDLSYRIRSAGYKNYYFPETQIIHYKGESTRKSSVNYVFVFYRAMAIFARKHFSRKNASIFAFFINLAIYIRAFGAIIHRFISRLLLLLIDILLGYGGLYLVKIYWEKTSFGYGYKYPDELLYTIFPVYILLWIFGLFLLRGYSKPYRFSKIIRGVILGTIFISIVYAFLEESYRFSRAIILLGALTSFIAFFLSRLIVHFLQTGNLQIYRNNENRIAIVGHESEATRVLKLLKSTGLQYNSASFIFPDEYEKHEDEMFIGYLSQIEEVINVNRINELIFCDKDIPSYQVINLMNRLQSGNLVFKIAPRETLFVIGSNSRNSPGDLYAIDIQLAITKSLNRIYKRVMDVVISVLSLVLSPFFILLQKNKVNYFKNNMRVFTARYTYVSYSGDPESDLLPRLKKGILKPSDQFKNQNLTDANDVSECNMLYAKNYSPFTDLVIILKNLRKLGELK